METPEYILQMIRQNWGLGQYDTSKDHLIRQLPPRAKLATVIYWEYGNSRLAEIILMRAEHCGFEIKEKE